MLFNIKVMQNTLDKSKKDTIREKIVIIMQVLQAYSYRSIF